MERHSSRAAHALLMRPAWLVSEDHLSRWRCVLQAPQADGAQDSMIDFGDEVGASLQDGVYQPGRRDVDQEGEPEARKVCFPTHPGLQRNG